MEYDTLMQYYPFINKLFNDWKVNEDCQQMIWEALLTYDQNKILLLHTRGELKFWLTRFIKNNWFSKNSRYYYTYKRYYKIFEDNYAEIEPVEDDD